MRITLILGFVCTSALVAEKFEVASIKPGAPRVPGQPYTMGSSGGPGSKDPSQFRCSNCNVATLLERAFGVSRYQLTGPNWIDDERFEVVARIPAGATKEQFGLMLQDLLAERFGLQFHREQKEVPVFDLVIAKGGLKMKEHVDEPAKENGDDAPSIGLGGGGISGALSSARRSRPGGSSMSGSGQTIEQLCGVLSRQVNRPVHDATGLAAKYDYQLSFASDRLAPSADTEDRGPTLFVALQEQLGLKLESKKGMMDVIVIDKLEKTPTEN